MNYEIHSAIPVLIFIRMTDLFSVIPAYRQAGPRRRESISNNYKLIIFINRKWIPNLPAGRQVG